MKLIKISATLVVMCISVNAFSSCQYNFSVKNMLSGHIQTLQLEVREKWGKPWKKMDLKKLILPGEKAQKNFKFLSDCKGTIDARVSYVDQNGLHYLYFKKLDRKINHTLEIFR